MTAPTWTPGGHPSVSPDLVVDGAGADVVLALACDVVGGEPPRRHAGQS